MCIICNVPATGTFTAADDFLSAFEQSRQAMRSAADHMLEVSKIAISAEDRRRYDMMHKEMVRQIRAWNGLEQKRERQDAFACAGA